MIHCSIPDFHRYQSLNAHFQALADFLQSGKLSTLGAGRYDIVGDELYVIVSPEAATRPTGILEAHNRYIDVHTVIAGRECMGWAPRAQLQVQDAPFDAERDFICYRDKYRADFCVNPGELVVFFPEDGHAPLIGDGTAIHKAVFKVRVD